MTSGESGDSSTSQPNGLNITCLLWFVVGLAIAVLSIWFRGLESVIEIVSFLVSVVGLLLGGMIMFAGLLLIPSKLDETWKRRLSIAAVFGGITFTLLGGGLLGETALRIGGTGDPEKPLVPGLALAIAGVALLLVETIDQVKRSRKRTEGT